jgi:hypothetical protein
MEISSLSCHFNEASCPAEKSFGNIKIDKFNSARFGGGCH